MIDRITKHDGTLSDRVDAAFSQVADEVITRAERAGTQVLIWRDNKIVRLSPKEATQEILLKKASGS